MKAKLAFSLLVASAFVDSDLIQSGLVETIASVTSVQAARVQAVNNQHNSEDEVKHAKKHPSKAGSKHSSKKSSTEKTEKTEKTDKTEKKQKKEQQKAPAKKQNKPVESEELSLKDQIEITKFSQSFNGADESDVIENIYNHYGKHAKDAAG